MRRRMMNTLLAGACMVLTAASALAHTPPSLSYITHSMDGKTATYLAYEPRNPSWPYYYKLETRTIYPTSEWRELSHSEYTTGNVYTSDSWEYILNLDPSGYYNEFRLVQYQYGGARIQESEIRQVFAPSETIEYWHSYASTDKIYNYFRVRGTVRVQLADGPFPWSNWQTVPTVSESPVSHPWYGCAEVVADVAPFAPQFARLEVVTDSGTYYTNPFQVKDYPAGFGE